MKKVAEERSVTFFHYILQKFQTDSRAFRQDYMAADYFHAAEEIVRDQEIAVEVAEIHGRRELGGCGYCT